MSLEGNIYTVLSGATAVTDETTAIYPEHRLYETTTVALPAIVYSRLAGSRVNDLSGYSGLENAVVEIDVYTSSVDKRRIIGDAVVATMTAATVFKCILTDSPIDDYISEENEVREYIRTFDFSIWTT